MSTTKIHSLTEFADQVHVFRDRSHAGEILADMLEVYRGSEAIILAIPAGGVPVASVIATRLELPMDLLVASKILYPWTTEAGFGAVAFDGSQWLNQAAIKHYDLGQTAIDVATEEALKKIRRRLKRFRKDTPFPTLHDRPVILVDDGIAAGSTIRAGILSLKHAGATRVIIATPTAHDTSLREIAELVNEVYCANIRGGYSFAVASAYQHWTDVGEDEVEAILTSLKKETVNS